MKKYLLIPIFLALLCSIAWAAPLSDAKRSKIWADIMSEGGGFGTLNKYQLKAVIEAADNWIGSSTSSFNNSLPEPGKSQLDMKMKLKIFRMLIKIRWEEE